jgi:hypothetical protein
MVIGRGSPTRVLTLVWVLIWMLLGAGSANASISRGAIVVKSKHAAVPVSCAVSAGSSCHLVVNVTGTRTVHDGRLTVFRRRVLLGRASVVITAGYRGVALVSLDAAGRALLASRHSLRARYTVRLTSVTAPDAPVAPPRPVGVSPTPLPRPGPVCVPPTVEPSPTTGPGPTSLVGQLFGGGGGPPRCDGGTIKSMPGTIEVLGGKGEVLATQTVAEGQAFDISVPAGTYTVAGAIGSSTEFSCKSDPVTAIEGQRTLAELSCPQTA